MTLFLFGYIDSSKLGPDNVCLTDFFVFPPFCLSGTGGGRGEWSSSLDSSVRVPSPDSGSIDNLHLVWPIGFPLLGQWTNHGTDECYQDDSESAGLNSLHVVLKPDEEALMYILCEWKLGCAQCCHRGTTRKKTFPVASCVSHNPSGAHQYHRHRSCLRR